MRTAVPTLLAFVVMAALTAAATLAGATGLGLDDTLGQQVSLRNDSVRAGRPFVGGGLRGGK